MIISDLLQIRKDIGDCQRCPLFSGRKNIVFGEGSITSKVMFIGEAPGEKEDETGRPFVGRSGELLDEALGKCGWSRESIYISNVIKCRPPGNRDPLPLERETCSPFLRRQIDTLNPGLLVSLGRIPASFLLGREVKITKERGQTFPFNPRPEIGVMVVYHPSYVLRNRTKETLESFYSDIAKVKEIVDAL